MRIVLCFPVENRHVEAIRQAAPADATVVNAGQERVNEELPGADVFIGHAKVPVDWDAVIRPGTLRWIQSSAAGLDHCLVRQVIEDPRIEVSSASGLFAPQVTEQTMALLFGLVRSMPAFSRAAERKEFVRLPTDDLRGKTVGIVGLGGNGKCIARALQPMCERIVATDYFPKVDCPYVDQVWPHDELSSLLICSDVVILALPLNAHTERLLNADRFAEMKSGSYLINVARGQVVDEPALIDALQSGHLRGAGLDVTETEPLPTDSPLWEIPNVLITPHVGAQSFRRVDDTVDLACENLRRWQAGLPLYNRVDKKLGFPHPDVIWNSEK